MWREEQIGEARLILGDCLEILPTLPKVDAVVTDPPYGENYASNMTGRFKGVAIQNDESTAARDGVLSWWGTRPAVIFGKWSVPKWGHPRGVLVWDKGPASGMGDLSFPWKPSWEDIAIYGDGWQGHRGEGVLKGDTVVTWSGRDDQRKHPNEKPVSLLVRILQKSTHAIILDPFMGSGTTGVACAQIGRKFIGIEIEPKYFDIACRRIEQEYAQGKLFEPEQRKPTQEALI